MTEGLKRLLQYQEMDREVYRMENELRRSSEATMATKLRGEVVGITQSILKLDTEAQELMSAVDRWERELDALPTDEVRAKINACTNLDQIATYEKQLNKLNDSYTAMNAELTRIQKRLKEIGDEYKRLNAKGLKAQENYQKAQAVYKAKQDELEVQLQPQKAQLEALRKGIPDDMFRAYLTRREQRKFPPFVQYRKGCCGGCGMDISAEVAAKLRTQQLAECPSCRRVVYPEDD